jgi:hypothetical protein
MSTQLYECTLIGNYNGQVELVNRWNYRGDVNGVSGGDAAALVHAMGFAPTGGTFPVSTIGASIQAITNTIVSWTQCLCRNVYDPTDFIDLPFSPSAQGANAGECLSPINAFGFRSNRTRLDIGRGYKRFCGVSEGESGGGGIVVPAAKTALDALAAQMGAIITFTAGGLTDTFTPVVVQKFKLVRAGRKDVYKYWDTPTEQLAHLAVGVTWEAYNTVRSQVSRQYGRGA